MALFEASVATAAANANAPYLQIHTQNPRIRVKQIEIISTQATLVQLGLARSAMLGSGPTFVVGQAIDPADQVLSVTQLEIAWGAAPTIAGTPVYLKRGHINNIPGNGLVWPFPDGRWIPASSGLVIWNIGASAGPILFVNVLWDNE